MLFRLRVLACAWVCCALLRVAAGQSDLAAPLGALAGPDAGQAARAFETLVEAGDAAVLAAAEAFETLPVGERRARAKFFAAAVSDATFPRIAAFADDADPAVRRSLLLACAHARLHAAERLGARVELLVGRLEREHDRALRQLALETLGRLESPLALDALERALENTVGDERLVAARALARRAAGRVRVLARCERALAEPGDADVLAEWLADGFGEALAERAAPSAQGDEFAAFARFARHPSPEVRAATQLAVDAYVERLRFLGDADRAEAAYPKLLGRGLNDVELRLDHARFVLEAGRSPEAALAPARALARELGDGSDVTRRRALAATHVLAGAAELCLREFDGAEASFARAAAVLDALIEEHPESFEPSLSDVASDALELRGVCETWRVLILVARGVGSADDRVLERAVAAHRFSLRSQAVVWKAKPGDPPIGTLDDLLRHRSGPLRLFLLNDRAGGLPRELRLRAMRAFGDALATVAPAELPGFRPAAVDPQRSDFLIDPTRLGVFDGLRGRIAELAEKDPRPNAGFDLDARVLEFVRDSRWPGPFALTLAAHLRQDGRPAESRELAEALIEALQTSAARQSYWAESLIAQAEGAIGDSYTDENDGERADETLNRALTRYTDIETALRANPLASRFAETMRGQRAATLTSLAVNANVKRKRPDLALEYFERSIAIERTAFSDVLLACYRARAGRTAEARASLAEIPEAPGNYYNLACTWALLGDKDTALAYLARELADPDASRGSRERQKTWAKDDPDLASLRGDPRFEELLR